MDSGIIERGATSSAPEDLFTELFTQVFGVEKTLLLAPQYPVTDIYEGNRFVDFALRTRDERIAFEIDGLIWHLPDATSVAKFEDDLLRQNSLVYHGWRVFRWTDRQVGQEPERVKEELAKFLERLPGLLSFDDFLPRQSGELVELRAHQDGALLALQRIRAEGKTIALVEHATGAGKTVTAISDARRLGGRTLWLVHRRNLIVQTQKEFQKCWPESETGRYHGGTHESEADNLVALIQSVAHHLEEFAPTEFAYLVIDEAHHAAADTYRRVLGYFRPQFVLGLTATAERADGQELLELFRDCAHRLTLREAVERGELVPIRCVRVETNVNLTKVRYNQVQYNRRDIEESIAIPARDRLIVDTYQQHVPGRKAVAFAVNVRHGEDLAQEFRRSGVAAQSVSGRMSNKEREQHLQAFREGELRVLCACDILNEGWDCPDVEVLLMARPTLSKVVYLQQLGRGTRKAPGKECLIVFDFVDNATRYNQSLNLHRVLGQNRYRRGSLVLAPQGLLDAEEASLARGDRPTAVLEIGLWAKDYQEIDVFNWQQEIVNLLSIPDLERELGVGEGRVKGAVERGQVKPDHTLQLGERIYFYFHRDRTEEVREAIGAPKMDEHTIRDRFLQFVGAMDMTLSYKPVMLLALLDAVAEDGRAKVSEVVGAFRQFYQERRSRGLIVERPGARKQPVDELDDATAQRLMLGKPFETFERRRFLRYDRDLAYVRFDPRLWRQLGPEDLAQLRSICRRSIEVYYERFRAM
ncbi:MAG TPA: DEAD/DEAH box helicase family protein [Gemmataceae bacterium]|nr:DEAD/DEAH box helicase family protein [Gemmataceae bacterium]